MEERSSELADPAEFVESAELPEALLSGVKRGPVSSEDPAENSLDEASTVEEFSEDSSRSALEPWRTGASCEDCAEAGAPKTRAHTVAVAETAAASVAVAVAVIRAGRATE